MRCGRAQVRSYKGTYSPVPISSLWERTLCATNLRSGTPQRGCRAQGALPQTSLAPGATRIDHAWAKADAQRGFALSPLRHGALRCSGIACRTIATLPIPSSDRRPYPTRRYEPLLFLGHSLWVTFLLGQQEKSDSSGGSRSKRPPRRRHAGLNVTTKHRGSR